MAGLFVAQQIAGAANVEIMAGQLEPGAQTIQIAQHFQPLACDLRQLSVGRRGEIGIGPQF
jgi:hypothetical protein